MFLNIPGEIKSSHNCRRKSQIHGELRKQTCIDQVGWHGERSTVSPGIWDMASSPLCLASNCAVETVPWTLSVHSANYELCDPGVSSLASLCLAALLVKGLTPHCDVETNARSNSQKAFRSCFFKKNIQQWSTTLLFWKGFPPLIATAWSKDP